jgi:hypothetical protein
MKGQGLWRVSIVLFFIGVISIAAPVRAEVGSAALDSFSWGQVTILLAIAAAWGDMRGQVRDLRRDVDHLQGKGRK